ncbi:MAG TPA: hypothetical protein VM535_00610, partial [Candidatus Saccharimonadales bacterium]|nr:hypothetical protein [Candidatus Saccharimonadales bacterium]
MEQQLLNLKSTRAAQARWGKRIGQTGYKLLLAVSGLSLFGGLFVLFFEGSHYGYLLLALAVSCYMKAVWWKRRLSVLPPDGTDLNGRLSGELLALLKPGTPQQPQAVWQALTPHWQARFFGNHLLLPKDTVSGSLSTDPAALGQALQVAVQLADKNQSPTVEPGFVVAGLLLTSPNIRQLLTQLKARPEDVEAVADWLGRGL